VPVCGANIRTARPKVTYVQAGTRVLAHPQANLYLSAGSIPSGLPQARPGRARASAPKRSQLHPLLQPTPTTQLTRTATTNQQPPISRAAFTTSVDSSASATGDLVDQTSGPPKPAGRADTGTHRP
jgi:hypothetical protein